MTEMNENVVTIKDQIKKFALKGAIGFQTVLVYGLGMRLGIFEYLHEKGKSLSSSEKISEVSFTPNELIKKLEFNPRYLDAWLHMAIACGIFELDDSCETCIKTAPHVYDILINRDSMFYAGGTLNTFYILSQLQDRMFDNFKTGYVMIFTDGYNEAPEINKMGQSGTAIVSRQTEALFSKYCKEHKRKLKKGGLLLEVGCGYGYNLEFWAKNYKKAQIVGIDIDPHGIAFIKELIAQKGWTDRIEILNIPIDEYAVSNKNKFDVAMLNQVIHEMNPDENYRRGVLEDIYSMLNDGGLLLVAEHMIPDLFTPVDRFIFFEVWHKFLEVTFNSKFYNEQEFREFALTTSFKNVELITDGNDYAWALLK